MTRRILVLTLVAVFSSSFAVGKALADGPGARYAVTVAPVSAPKGQPAKATVLIKPAAGYHLNEEFPTKLALKPTVGVVLAKAEFAKQDAKLSRDEGRFEVTLVGNEPGQKAVQGSLKFAVCTETTCEPQNASVRIDFLVK